jgi:hypothetical protein
MHTRTIYKKNYSIPIKIITCSSKNKLCENVPEESCTLMEEEEEEEEEKHMLF